MRIATALLLLQLPINRLSGQPTGAAVIASAARVVTMPGPGEAVFMVRASTGLDSSVASVIAALAPARVGPADLASRSIFWDSPDTNLPGPQEFLFWLVRPGASYLELQSVMKSISNGNRDLSITFRGYTQAAEADIEQARARVLPDLYRQAKARAEQMLIEAGYRPGAIVELNETIDPFAASHRGRFSLSMRMARLGVPVSRTSVSTVVMPAVLPLRMGSPLLQVSFSVRSMSRRDLLALVRPAGLTESQLTRVEAESDRFSQDRGRDPGPATLRYYFTSPIAEGDIRARLGRLPQAITDRAEVSFAAEPSLVDATMLAAAARSRAALLARLLGGQLGDGVRVSEDRPGRTPVRAIELETIPGNTIPAERVVPIFSLVRLRPLPESAAQPTSRYQFATTITAP